MKINTQILFVIAVSSALSFSGPEAKAELKLHSAGKNKNFIYDHDPKALASTVYLVFRNGSLSDPKDKEGLTKTSFEALARGTEKLSRPEFIDAIETLGASLEFDVASNRSIVTLNTISDNMESSIRLLAEAVLHPGLRKAEIDQLIDEEKARLTQEKSNNRSLMKRSFRQALFGGGPLAFPPEGTLDGVSSISVDDIRRQLAAEIRSGNLIVAVSSNRKEAQVKGWIENAFRELPDGPTMPAVEVPPPRLSGRTVYLVPRKGSATTEMALGHFGIRADNPEREVLETGMFVFGTDFSSRLMTVLRKQNGWTYGATAGYQLLELPRRHGGAFLIYSFPQAEHTEKAVLKALSLYEDYVKKGVTKAELGFAKNSEMNSYPFRLASSRSRVLARLYEALDGAPFYSLKKYREIVGKVTQESVLKAVRKFHDPKNMVIVLVGDPAVIEETAKKIPGVSQVRTVEDPMKTF